VGALEPDHLGERAGLNGGHLLDIQLVDGLARLQQAGVHVAWAADDGVECTDHLVEEGLVGVVESGPPVAHEALGD